MQISPESSSTSGSGGTGQSGAGHLGNSKEWSRISLGGESSDGDGANRTFCRFRLLLCSGCCESIDVVEASGVGRPVGQVQERESRVRDLTWSRINLALAVVKLRSG